MVSIFLLHFNLNNPNSKESPRFPPEDTHPVYPSRYHRRCIETPLR